MADLLRRVVVDGIVYVLVGVSPYVESLRREKHGKVKNGRKS